MTATTKRVIVTSKERKGEKITLVFFSADEHLTFAFRKCHKKSVKNKQLILTYLIPVKMILGYMPSKVLLEKYNLMQFSELKDAVQKGDVRTVEDMMRIHESFLAGAGIYLIVEKLKQIACRNLFKRVFLILNTHQIPVHSLLAALETTGIEDIDLDATECLIANLIQDGKIKGYISHQHRKLVISKQNPFPCLSSM